MSTVNTTPMVEQYMQIKSNYPDALLFFRLGDFYELFFDDALVGAKELEITLTSRGKSENKIPMCGVPYHSVDTYIAKLISKGFKIAICEQIEDPKKAKGIVKRDVIRVITPGTVINDNILAEKYNNYLLTIVSLDDEVGLAYVDTSTGEFNVTSFNIKDNIQGIANEYIRIAPSEVIIEKKLLERNLKFTKTIKSIFANTLINEWDQLLDISNCREQIKKYLKNIDFDTYDAAQIVAIGNTLSYLEETQKISLQHINKIDSYAIENYMEIDIQTRKNLEVTASINDKKNSGTLLAVIDKTKTAMGGRKIKSWLNHPLINMGIIKERLEITEELVNNISYRAKLGKYLDEIYDLERIISKLSYGSINPRDVLALKHSLNTIYPIKELLKDSPCKGLQNILKDLYDFYALIELIETAIHENPPITITEGGIIKQNYNEKIDELRDLAKNSKKYILDLEMKEREKTGIKSLKIGYNKVFGYYIEITNSNLNNVPETYIRKQTLTNAERYITPELKELEDLVMHATEKLYDLEYKTFLEIRDKISLEMENIQISANAIATLDIFYSFAEIAVKYNYVKPIINDSTQIKLQEMRHPVIEQAIGEGEYIKNDCQIDPQDNVLSIITGPNMAGKSTYIRTVAIICILAQVGSFVPAKYAEIGLVDKLFARIGASDDIATGQSTFMVEMNEVAHILNNATHKSLLILDEVGRGTSTYDGLSIAWSISEYIAQNLQARTLFATHYHELIELEKLHTNIKNYSMAVREIDDEVVFLRKVIPGGVDKSYGIYVAQLAGLPESVILKAKEKLNRLENEDNKYTKSPVITPKVLDIDPEIKELISKLDRIDLNNITPLESLLVLDNLKKLIINTKNKE